MLLLQAFLFGWSDCLLTEVECTEGGGRPDAALARKGDKRIWARRMEAVFAALAGHVEADAQAQLGEDASN